MFIWLLNMNAYANMSQSIWMNILICLNEYEWSMLNYSPKENCTISVLSGRPTHLSIILSISANIRVFCIVSRTRWLPECTFGSSYSFRYGCCFSSLLSFSTCLFSLLWVRVLLLLYRDSLDGLGGCLCLLFDSLGVGLLEIRLWVSLLCADGFLLPLTFYAYSLLLILYFLVSTCIVLLIFGCFGLDNDDEGLIEVSFRWPISFFWWLSSFLLLLASLLLFCSFLLLC